MTEQEKFDKLVKPLIEFLNEYSPHSSIIIDTTHAELLQGVMAFESDEFIKD